MRRIAAYRLTNFFYFLILLIGLFVYWAYLAFVTEPIFVHDAKGYHDLGSLIYQKGLKAYFVSGPNRELIYPLLISFCMQIAGQSYYPGVLKFLQIMFLLGTVVLTFILLKRAKLLPGIAVLAVGYLGLSPAFINSALSIYSEVATYLAVMGIIFVSVIAWPYLQKDSAKLSFGYGAALGLSFVVMTLVKGIYEIIFPLFLMPFIVLGVWAFWKRNKNVVRHVGVFLLAAVVVFGSCIAGYKAVNKKYNGLFALTDRGAWAMYGNTARRQQPLTLRKFLAGVAYNLFEEDGCAVLLDRQSCHFWDVRTSDDLAAQKNHEVSAKFPPQQRDRQFAKLIFDKIVNNPLQYILLDGFDWVHMFFWESTRIGFVAYPDWLDGIFDNVIFARVLRFGVGLLSLWAVFFAGSYIYRHKVSLWQTQGQQDVFLTTLFFLVYLIVCHVTLYSLFATVARFSLPIAPLFVSVIACAVQILFKRNQMHRI